MFRFRIITNLLINEIKKKGTFSPKIVRNFFSDDDLIEKFVDPVNQQDSQGNTVFHYLIEFFLENKIDIGTISFTISFFADDLNANLNIENHEGDTPIDLCNKRNAKKISQIIKDNSNKFTDVTKENRKTHILNLLVNEPHRAISGKFTEKNWSQDDSRCNTLVGHPGISECHCCPQLSRGKNNLRDELEEQSLTYIDQLPGPNKVAIIGSGKLLRTLSLITKFIHLYPGEDLEICLIDHSYATKDEDTVLLFKDFAELLDSYGVNVNFVGKIFKFKKTLEKNNCLNLRIAVFGDVEEYLEYSSKNKIPTKLIIASDLDLHGQDQEEFVKKSAEKANAKSYVSIDKYSLGHNVLNSTLYNKEEMFFSKQQKKEIKTLPLKSRLLPKG